MRVLEYQTRRVPVNDIFAILSFVKTFSYVAWTQALLATLGSLFMSRFLHFPPCELCWYQRALMFPLVVVIAVGILRKDKNMPFYALPLSIGGLIVASYHNLLYYGLIPETISPCTIGASCTQKQLELFGFVTIPLLSFISFAIITFCMVLVLKKKTK